MSQPEPSPASTFAAGLSTHPNPAEAVAEVVVQVTERLDDRPPSVAVVFAAGSAAVALDKVVDTIGTLLGPEVLIGCTADGVVGGGEEVEGGDALALWAATGVPASAVRLESIGRSSPVLAGLPPDLAPGSALAVLADPHTFAVDALVGALNESLDPIEAVGGLVAAGAGPEGVRLVLGDRMLTEGAVAAVFPPGVAVPVVSQGCKPIGSPWVITETDGPLVRQLGGRPALERLTTLIESLSPRERAAAAQGLQVGLVANDQQHTFDQGDFLVRSLLGADRSSGSLAIGDRAEVGQVLQFQVRDGESASADLDRLLAPVRGRGALLFTCNGRGSRLFAEPSHDATRLTETLGPAVAGMFCSGELGPIAGRNAVHAFTATLLAFR